MVARAVLAVGILRKWTRSATFFAGSLSIRRQIIVTDQIKIKVRLTIKENWSYKQRTSKYLQSKLQFEPKLHGLK